jgi:hypothetical protein
MAVSSLLQSGYCSLKLVYFFTLFRYLLLKRFFVSMARGLERRLSKVKLDVLTEPG